MLFFFPNYMLRLKGYGIDSSPYAREYVLVFRDFLRGFREKLKFSQFLMTAKYVVISVSLTQSPSNN